MKLLLDESVPRRLKRVFPDGFDVLTVGDVGWTSTKNGELLRLAAAANFDVLITADKGFEHQHNVETLPIPVVILHSYRTTLADLLPLVPEVARLVESVTEKKIYHVRA